MDVNNAAQLRRYLRGGCAYTATSATRAASDCCLYIVGSNNVSAFEDNGGFSGYGPVDSLV